MFDGAVIKLRDARTAMARLIALTIPPVASNVQIISGLSGPSGDPSGTSTPVEFAEAFSSCVAQVRSVGDAVLKDKEANKLPGFAAWREAKKTECKNDALLAFINDRRNGDLHEGHSPLVFTMHAFSFDSGAIGSPPSPTASMFIDGSGPHWLVDQGTPLERNVPCEVSSGVTYTVAIGNPPTKHLGSILPSTDSVSILSVAEGYFAKFLFEAKSRFA